MSCLCSPNWFVNSFLFFCCLFIYVSFLTYFFHLQSLRAFLVQAFSSSWKEFWSVLYSVGNWVIDVVRVFLYRIAATKSLVVLFYFCLRFFYVIFTNYHIRIRPESTPLSAFFFLLFLHILLVLFVLVLVLSCPIFFLILVGSISCLFFFPSFFYYTKN